MIKKVEAVYRKMMAKKTGEERMLMGFSMFDFSSRIFLSSMKKNIPSNEQKKEIFLRLYRDDFSKEQQEKILKLLLPDPKKSLKYKLKTILIHKNFTFKISFKKVNLLLRKIVIVY